MNTVVTLAVFFLSVAAAQAQIYVVGDTTGKYVYNPEYAFYNASASIDLDCNDTADLAFNSYAGGQFPHDWSKLTIWRGDSTEILNAGIGAVKRFKTGDTLYLASDVWTPYLDYIWGMGGMGSYGWAQIDTEYIAARKIMAGDTSYVFLKVSTANAWMKIHQIISDCAANPLQQISAVVDPAAQGNFFAYPNPFSGQLTFPFTNNQPGSITLYNFLGQQVLQQSFTNSVILNTEQLANGIYFYELRNTNGALKTGKVVRQ